MVILTDATEEFLKVDEQLWKLSFITRIKGLHRRNTKDNLCSSIFEVVRSSQTEKIFVHIAVIVVKLNQPNDLFRPKIIEKIQNPVNLSAAIVLIVVLLD